MGSIIMQLGSAWTGQAPLHTLVGSLLAATSCATHHADGQYIRHVGIVMTCMQWLMTLWRGIGTLAGCSDRIAYISLRFRDNI